MGTHAIAPTDTLELIARLVVSSGVFIPKMWRSQGWAGSWGSAQTRWGSTPERGLVWSPNSLGTPSDRLGC